MLILQPFRHFTYVTAHSLTFHRFTYVTAHSPTLPLLQLRHSSFSNPSFASLTPQALHLIHLAEQSSFSNRSVISPTSQLILQPFRRFTHVIDNSPTLPLLQLRHSSFSNPSFASLTPQALHLIHLAEQSSFSTLSVILPTSQLILLPFRRFTYVTTHSPTLPSLYLRHNSFSYPSVALPTSQIILQPFIRYSYVTVSSLNSPGRAELILQPFRHFTYVTTHSPTLLLLYLRHGSFSNPSVVHLRHSSFSNPSFASPTSQALHLFHLAEQSSFSKLSVTSPTS